MLPIKTKVLAFCLGGFILLRDLPIIGSNKTK